MSRQKKNKMADTWLEIQLFRKRHRCLKERLSRRKSGHLDKQPPLCVTHIDPALERKIMEGLMNPSLEFPLDVQAFCKSIGATEWSKEEELRSVVEKMAAQNLLEVHATDISILSVDLDRIYRLGEGLGIITSNQPPLTKKHCSVQDEIDFLLSLPTVRETDSKKLSNDILELLNTKTVKEQQMVAKFQSIGGSQLREFCVNKTKEDCRRTRGSRNACAKLHFRRIIQNHTDESLGDCSFLNTCFHMETCKFVHYAIDDSIDEPESLPRPVKVKQSGLPRSKLFPQQWVQCDLRTFDMSVLGKFAVIMADPPWDIHMELPYGTMSDDEMRQLNIPALQDDGYIFLWVTGRAMELGRECLTLWGYERVDELIWVKTNQLQRLIRTGRTGHWINHGKEHCLVGQKGNPEVNRGIDTDVIVAEVRATSHKPDEIYGVIERLSPGTLKVELFGRPHNCQPNWVTLGNQLDGVRILDQSIRSSFYKRYPRGEIDTMMPPQPRLPQ